MASGRAKTGGETGMNGEHYKGGTFLPSTRLPKRGSGPRIQATQRVLVAPGEFAVLPAGRHSIFGRISHFVEFKNGTAVPRFADDHRAVEVHFDSPAELHRLITAFNLGERDEPAPVPA